jgi:hypothetical protein
MKTKGREVILGEKEETFKQNQRRGKERRDEERTTKKIGTERSNGKKKGYWNRRVHMRKGKEEMDQREVYIYRGGEGGRGGNRRPAMAGEVFTFFAGRGALSLSSLEGRERGRKDRRA